MATKSVKPSASCITFLEDYIARTYPAIALETWEEERIVKQLVDTRYAWEQREHLVLTASAASPLTDARTGKALMPAGPAAFGALFAEAVKAARSHAGNTSGVRTIMVLMDFQHVVNNAGAYRALINIMEPAKAAGLTVLLAAPSWKLPDELKHRVPVLSVSLPGVDDLKAVAKNAAQWTGIEVSETDQNEMCRAALGLTIEEAENAFTLAASVSSKTFQIGRIEREKMRLVRSQCLSVESPLPLEMFGGYGRLKSYLADEVLPNKDDQELRVRGILLVSPPGTGKSTACRAIASVLGWPLIRLDLPAAKGGIVGQTEANIRQAFSVIRATGNCVVWCDEIEKAVGGYASSAVSDSGVTMGLVGSLLIEMQEQKDAIYVASSNDFSKLPPELTRAGRFDERFFLDLPSAGERAEIAVVHLKRFGLPEALVGSVSEMTPDWTGAEIEHLIKSAARRTQRKVTEDALRSAAADIVPIARYQDVGKLREWAKTRLRLANDEERTPDVVAPRKMFGGNVGGAFRGTN